MGCLDPEAVFLYLLAVIFLVRRKWKLAFAAFGFILMASLFDWLLKNRFGTESQVAELTISIFLIIGCVWLAISGLVGFLGEGRGEPRS